MKIKEIYKLTGKERLEVFLINAEIKREIGLKKDRVPLLRIYAFFVLYFIILYYIVYCIICYII